MELTVLGSGSAMPVPDRVQAGYLLDDGDRSLLVDCGSGVLQRLAGTETGYEGVSTVLLTHHHLDHVAALLPLMKARWLAGEEHLEVVGPAGTKSLLDGLLDVHEYLDGRIDLAVREVSAARPFAAAGFDVTARETRHSMDGFAYRFSPPSADFDPANGPLTLSGTRRRSRAWRRSPTGATCWSTTARSRTGPTCRTTRTPRNWGVARGHRYRHAAALAPVPAHRGREREMAQSVRDAGFDGDVEVASDGLRVAIAERSGSAGDGSAAGAGEANEADEADEADETDEADEAAEADGT